MMSYAASITILTVITVERYFAILHPFRCKRWKTLGLLRVVLVLVWSASAICGIPQLIFYSMVELPMPSADAESGFVQLNFCIVVVRHNQKAYVTTNFVLWYLLPLVLMTLVYSRISVVLWRSSRPDACGGSSSTTSPNLPSAWRAPQTSRKAKVRQVALELSQQCKEEDSRPENYSSPTEEGRENYSGCERETQIEGQEKVRGEGNRACRLTSETDESLSEDSTNTGCCPAFTKSPVTSLSGCKSKTHLGSPSSDLMELRRLVTTPTSKSGDDGRGAQSGCLRNGSLTKDTLVRQGGGGGGAGPKTKTMLKFVRFRSVDRVDGALASRRRVIRLLIAVIVCFALCVLPYHVLMMWHTWRPVSANHHPTPYGQLLAAPIIFLIFYLNSALNPLLYAFLSDNFRRSLGDLLHRRPAGFVTSRQRRSTFVSKTTNQTLV